VKAGTPSRWTSRPILPEGNRGRTVATRIPGIGLTRTTEPALHKALKDSDEDIKGGAAHRRRKSSFANYGRVEESTPSVHGHGNKSTFGEKKGLVVGQS